MTPAARPSYTSAVCRPTAGRPGKPPLLLRMMGQLDQQLCRTNPRHARLSAGAVARLISDTLEPVAAADGAAK
ncbi:MAG: hypothetical protein ACKODX_04315 [Gemmata sp.]